MKYLSDVNLNMRTDIPFLQSTAYYFVFYRHTDNEVLTVSQDFWRFTKILQKLFEGHTNDSEQFQKLPKISEDN